MVTIDLSQTTTRLAAQAATATAIAIAVAHFTTLERPYWIAMTAMVVLSGSFGENLIRGVERAGGTIAGLAVAEAFFIATHRNPTVLSLLLLVFLWGNVYAVGGPYRWIVVNATVAVAMLLQIVGQGELFWARLYDTLIGVVVAAAVSGLVLPQPTGKPVRQALLKVLTDGAAIVGAMIGDLAAGRVSADHAADLRAVKAEFDKAAPLIEAARAEAMLLGRDSDQFGKRVDALDRFLRNAAALADGLEDAIAVDIARPVAAELRQMADRIAANVTAIREFDQTGQRRPVARLNDLRDSLHGRLADRHLDTVEGRTAFIPFSHAVFLVTQTNRAVTDIARNNDLPVVTP